MQGEPFNNSRVPCYKRLARCCEKTLPSRQPLPLILFSPAGFSRQHRGSRNAISGLPVRCATYTSAQRSATESRICAATGANWLTRRTSFLVAPVNVTPEHNVPFQPTSVSGLPAITDASGAARTWSPATHSRPESQMPESCFEGELKWPATNIDTDREARWQV